MMFPFSSPISFQLKLEKYFMLLSNVKKWLQGFLTLFTSSLLGDHEPRSILEEVAVMECTDLVTCDIEVAYNLYDPTRK